MVALGARDGMPWWAGLVSAGITIAVLLVVGVLVRHAADADFDSLTGLSNRRGFDRALDTAIAGGDVPTIVLFDLDGFRAINDEFGHRAGDDALQVVTDTWRSLLDDRALLARYGGDEFALLLTNSTEAQAVAVADRLRDAISLDVCAGVTAWQPGESPSYMVSRADVGLYRAKASSRNRTVVESAAHPPLAAELAGAIQRAELSVHYQPIVDLPDGQLVGYEALVRWISRSHRIVPTEVISIAEEHGLIADLGRFVLRQACADAETLQRYALGRLITLHVNVSWLELLETSYVAGVTAILAETGWPAGQLVLEITETALDVETPTAIEKLTTLRGTGIKIAIDDFGTGYSSLRRLVTLPTDLLKLDRSFVSSSLRVSGPQLLTVIGQLGSRLGVPLIVEGIEDGYQADQLATLGFTLAQGYYFGRPEPLQRYTQTRAVPNSARGESTA